MLTKTSVVKIHVWVEGGGHRGWSRNGSQDSNHIVSASQQDYTVPWKSGKLKVCVG